ncbi:MAG: hypothetical protein BWX84_00031 [Verrucomicrobia bacterium ADurb.Bin118]|jgi:hypothetical protein|nr:MAG: hypothetical protein BWX84_00031 [Verrucomicrobia bacterium ADurb.Bin118]
MQKPSTTNWIIPERHDLLMVLDAKVIENADGTVSPTAHSGDPIEDFTQTRSAFLVQSAIDRVRAAIRNAGHTPLSVTPGTVPPEAFIHVLNLAAWQLVSSTPNLQMVVITERGAYSPLGDAFKAAEKYLAEIPIRAVTPPTDPTGRDYVNPVTWMDDVEEYTQAELDALTWTWAEFSALGYSYEEWSKLTNPPIRYTIKSGGVNPEQDMSLTPALTWRGTMRTQLGTP